ncbi:hypothetical protein X975_15869, partial [Stegodyphus mimosarum]
MFSCPAGRCDDLDEADEITEINGRTFDNWVLSEIADYVQRVTAAVVPFATSFVKLSVISLQNVPVWARAQWSLGFCPVGKYVMEFTTLKTKKHATKGKLTKLKDKITLSYDSADYTQVELFKSRLSNVMAEMSDIFSNIFVVWEEKDIQVFIEEQQEIEGTIDELFLMLTRVNVKNVKEVSGEAKSYEIASIRLLKLALPVLSGSTEEWLWLF